MARTETMHTDTGCICRMGDLLRISLSFAPSMDQHRPMYQHQLSGCGLKARDDYPRVRIMKWDAASGVFGRFNDCEFFAKYLRDAKGPSVPISERCSIDTADGGSRLDTQVDLFTQQPLFLSVFRGFDTLAKCEFWPYR